MDFGYDTDQQLTPWGTASESKSESSGGGSSSSHSSSWSHWNPWQEKLAKPWTALGKDAIDWIQGAYDFGQSNLKDVVQGVMGWSNSPPVQWRTGWKALTDSFTPTATEDFYQNSIRNPALREWQQVALPGLREGYAGNYYHADRMRRESDMAKDLALNLANKRADLAYQSQEAAKQRELQGAPTALHYADFIPKTQANFLQGLMQTTNPLLSALTEYMSRMLEQGSKGSSESSHWSRSGSHTVSGYQPDEQPPPPLPDNQGSVYADTHGSTPDASGPSGEGDYTDWFYNQWNPNPKPWEGY
jgi:hypothetical protein